VNSLLHVLKWLSCTLVATTMSFLFGQWPLCVCVWEGMGVCVWEGVGVYVWEGMGVCVWEGMGVCVWEGVGVCV
jgi:hypothetical protein